MSKEETMAKIASVQKRNPSRKWSEDDQQIRREIEKLAYQFFEERGYQHGFNQEDWLKAEAVVKSRRF